MKTKPNEDKTSGFGNWKQRNDHENEGITRMYVPTSEIFKKTPYFGLFPRNQSARHSEGNQKLTLIAENAHISLFHITSKHPMTVFHCSDNLPLGYMYDLWHGFKYKKHSTKSTFINTDVKNSYVNLNFVPISVWKKAWKWRVRISYVCMCAYQRRVYRKIEFHFAKSNGY